MTDLTDDYLTQLLKRHPDGEIHKTLTELKSLVQKLDSADLAARKSLLDEIRPRVSLLEHELSEEGQSGEDFINDEVFLSR